MTGSSGPNDDLQPAHVHSDSCVCEKSDGASSDTPCPPDQDDLTLATDELTDGKATPDQYDEIADREERVIRLAADRAAFERLLAGEFTGPDWDRYAEALAGYGVAVMKAWLCTGYIFALSSAKNRPVKPTDEDREALRTTPTLREDIAHAVVVQGLILFRTTALAGKGWNPEGGASITTYFMGACVLSFANEFNRHQRSEHRWRMGSQAAPSRLPDEANSMWSTSDSDPAGIVVGNDSVARLMDSLSTREKEMLKLRLEGYEFAEIAEITGDKSARKVEGVLYRMRKKFDGGNRGNHQVQRRPTTREAVNGDE